MTSDPAGQTCVILAGGLGTRLRSVIEDRPKSLAPVGDHTFLELLMRHLASRGVTDFVLSLGYRAEMIMESIRNVPLLQPVRYVTEQQPLGTGGAVANCLSALGLDEVLVANGDTWLDGDLEAMFMPLDRAAGEMFRMATVEVSDRDRFGGVVVDENRRVAGFVEKGSSGAGLINAGFYRLCREALPQRAGAWSLEIDALPDLVMHRRVGACVIDGAFIDIGVPVDYQRFCARYGR